MAEAKKKKNLLKKLKSDLRVELISKEPFVVKEEGQSSVTIRKNFKDETEIIVKVYHNDPKQARIIATKEYEELKKKYK